MGFIFSHFVEFLGLQSLFYVIVHLFKFLLPESQSIHRDHNAACLFILFAHSVDEMYLTRVFINYNAMCVCVCVCVFLFIRSFFRFMFASSKYITQTNVID